MRQLLVTLSSGDDERLFFDSRMAVEHHLNETASNDYRETVLAWIDSHATTLDIDNGPEVDHWTQKASCPITDQFDCQERSCELHYSLAPVMFAPEVER